MYEPGDQCKWQRSVEGLLEQASSRDVSSTVKPNLDSFASRPDLTSQGSESTPYDIDLTQESPSLCSQIISQRLEQCAGSSGGQRCGGSGVMRKVNSSQGAGVRRRAKQPQNVSTTIGEWGSILDSGSRPLAPKRMKLLTPSRPPTRRRGARRRPVGQTPISKRRSQRVRKLNALEKADTTDSPIPSVTNPSVSCEGSTFSSVDSPMNALNDSFYLQQACSQSASTIADATPDPITPGPCFTQPTHPPSTAVSAYYVSQTDIL